jgi:hypothetical protein
MKKFIAGICVLFGVALVACVTPYPKEVFCITVGVLFTIGGLVVLLDTQLD